MLVAKGRLGCTIISCDGGIRWTEIPRENFPEGAEIKAIEFGYALEALCMSSVSIPQSNGLFTQVTVI